MADLSEGAEDLLEDVLARPVLADAAAVLRVLEAIV